jgi:hypothetical protein
MMEIMKCYWSFQKFPLENHSVTYGTRKCATHLADPIYIFSFFFFYSYCIFLKTPNQGTVISSDVHF